MGATVLDWVARRGFSKMTFEGLSERDEGRSQQVSTEIVKE